jgi:aspartate/methionine/tyrosine aminotransferase
VIFKNLTGYEIDTLPRQFNLTDGHAFRRWSPAEEAIIDQAGGLFKTSDRRLQGRIEREYIQDFCRLGRQTYDDARLGYLMCFTASMAFEIVANFLRMNRRSVALIEPCFDNLADIFQRHDLPLEHIDDAWMQGPEDEFVRGFARIEADAICLVSPNNPTGVTLREANLRRLAAFCREQNKLLVLDACFRAYLPREAVYDQYQIILESGAQAMIIEDTGKTWPTAEIKAPFFAISRAEGLFDRIYDIYTDFLLHISPVGIKLLHEFIRLSQCDELEKIHSVVRINRQALYESIEGTFLTPCESAFASVSWLRIDYPISAMELKGVLDQHGIFVLPGNHFFWRNRHKGDRFIRVALTRDADMFRDAATLLRLVCLKIGAGAHTQATASCGE